MAHGHTQDAHGDDHDAHDEHDAHDDHHEEPPPPEPETPFWFTALGAVLFLAGSIAFLVMNADPADKTTEGARGAASAKPNSAQTAAPRPVLQGIPALGQPAAH